MIELSFKQKITSLHYDKYKICIVNLLAVNRMMEVLPWPLRNNIGMKRKEKGTRNCFFSSIFTSYIIQIVN